LKTSGFVGKDVINLSANNHSMWTNVDFVDDVSSYNNFNMAKEFTNLFLGDEVDTIGLCLGK
jgi:hypothetical protein